MRHHTAAHRRIGRRIAGAFFVAMTLAGPGAAEQPREQPLAAPGPSGPLLGTLLTPATHSGPVVLFIPGSGPTDRDGNSPAGLHSNTYRLLAEALARRGITTLRIDKRGLFGSAGALANPDAVTIADYAADVHGWMRVLGRGTGAACIWLLGHSEGGLVAMVAGQDANDVCGLILVAAPGRPVGEILRGQIAAQGPDPLLLRAAGDAIDALEMGRHVAASALPPPLLPLFRPSVQDFLISEFSYDPPRLIADDPKPVLLLQGLRDVQIGPEDARRLKAADLNAKLVLLPNVNHMLKTVDSDDVNANLATYANPNLPLAPGVADAIADFLTAARPGSAAKPPAN